MTSPFPVYIGHDRREPEATEVACRSLDATSSIPLRVVELREEDLRTKGFYDRPFRVEGQQRFDIRDGKPFSTDFSFTRFLVPVLQDFKDWALFCDGDFLFRADVKELVGLIDDGKAVMVVKHDYRPPEKTKMDGQRQERYSRKNWSSLILWNCAHPANAVLTAAEVNHRPGSYLHGFQWLEDELIGALPERWNWLEGWSSPEITPSAVHMTRGVPTMDGYENIPYAEEWRSFLSVDQKHGAL
ncbi:MAG: glycosyltransferase [Alphaproteobacteria bacterium]|nr:glycosyltransferase [Alphaproteobacteria bacterium]